MVVGKGKKPTDRTHSSKIGVEWREIGFGSSEKRRCKPLIQIGNFEISHGPANSLSS